jgi:hypothetical protein
LAFGQVSQRQHRRPRIQPGCRRMIHAHAMAIDQVAAQP